MPDESDFRRPLGRGDHIVHAVGTWIPIQESPGRRELGTRERLHQFLDTVLALPAARIQADRDVLGDHTPVAHDRGWVTGLDVKRRLLARVAELPVSGPPFDDDRAALDITVALPPDTAYAVLAMLLRRDASGLPPADDHKPGVLVHLRSAGYEDRLNLHVGMSAWANPPIALAPAVASTWQPMPGHDVLGVATRLAAVGRAWLKALDTSFPPTQYRIGTSVFRPPGYWFVTPGLVEGDGGLARRLRALCLHVGNTRATVVDSAVLNEDYRVWRRMERGDRDSRNLDSFVRPLYLVALKDGVDASGETRHHIERVAALLKTLHELEGRVAAALTRRQTDLELDERLLRTYQSAATAGTALWDRLAMHLPATSGDKLDRAYKQILLIHQTLLQSVSDLQNITMHIDETSRRIGATIADVERRFDETLVEELTVSPGAESDVEPRGIREAIVQTGLSSRVQREADLASRLAATVSGRTSRLFDAVAGALDGRRAREGDVLQRYTVRVVIVATLLGFAAAVLAGALTVENSDLAELSNVLAVDAEGPLNWQVIVVLASGGLTVVGAGFLTFQVRRNLNRGRRLGRSHVSSDLDQARRFLSACSSERLDWEQAFIERGEKRGEADGRRSRVWEAAAKRLPWVRASADHSEVRSDAPESSEDRWNREHRAWQRIDQAVAARYAEIWDCSHTRVYARRRPRKSERDVLSVLDRKPGIDLNRLEDRVGRWAIQSLLLTERPRRFDHYRLPRLCLLMRHIRRAQDAPDWMAPVGSSRTEWFDSPQPPVSSREVVLVLSSEFPGLSAPQAQEWDAELEGKIIGLNGTDEAATAVDRARASRITAKKILETISTWLDHKAAEWDEHRLASVTGGPGAAPPDRQRPGGGGPDGQANAREGPRPSGGPPSVVHLTDPVRSGP